ncbi:hypothetical protein MSG28_000528 [Choristoneura fumiferana]|uniref:Uncharacterized protein n=1 Tax=Choristoneura fumiferana TaxID=7141 RepID=A0ACC0K196_CHOFU|nr:hypothetical protein MSG28_000528 [Choristoneura fumiferana]
MCSAPPHMSAMLACGMRHGTYGQVRHEVRHGVAQVRVVLDGVVLEQRQHGSAARRRVQHQDQHAHAGSSTSGSGTSKKGCAASRRDVSGSTSVACDAPRRCMQRNVDRLSWTQQTLETQPPGESTRDQTATTAHETKTLYESDDKKNAEKYACGTHELILEAMHEGAGRAAGQQLHGAVVHQLAGRVVGPAPAAGPRPRPHQLRTALVRRALPLRKRSETARVEPSSEHASARTCMLRSFTAEHMRTNASSTMRSVLLDRFLHIRLLKLQTVGDAEQQLQCFFTRLALLQEANKCSS